jgi:uncharacterized membrane protein (UPF0127 family)
MKTIKVINSSSALPESLAAGWCSSFLCKFRGLMFRRSMPTDWGLLLVEAKDSIVNTSIHMFFVFFDLGVVWINDDGAVVDTCLAKKWVTIRAPKKPARYILEISPDRLAEFNIGDQISFVE